MHSISIRRYLAWFQGKGSAAVAYTHIRKPFHATEAVIGQNTMHRSLSLQFFSMARPVISAGKRPYHLHYILTNSPLPLSLAYYQIFLKKIKNLLGIVLIFIMLCWIHPSFLVVNKGRSPLSTRKRLCWWITASAYTNARCGGDCRKKGD